MGEPENEAFCDYLEHYGALSSLKYLSLLPSNLFPSDKIIIIC
jgi:hypothetical protein